MRRFVRGCRIALAVAVQVSMNSAPEESLEAQREQSALLGEDYSESLLLRAPGTLQVAELSGNLEVCQSLGCWRPNSKRNVGAQTPREIK